jgi:hypothetical protein
MFIILECALRVVRDGGHQLRFHTASVVSRRPPVQSTKVCFWSSITPNPPFPSRPTPFVWTRLAEGPTWVVSRHPRSMTDATKMRNTPRNGSIVQETGLGGKNAPIPPAPWRAVYAMAWLDGDAAPARPCKDGGRRYAFPPYFVGCVIPTGVTIDSRPAPSPQPWSASQPKPTRGEGEVSRPPPCERTGVEVAARRWAAPTGWLSVDSETRCILASAIVAP